MERWHALYTKPRCEQRVAEALGARGVEVWLPHVTHHGKRGQLLVKPFFPRYLFARFDWSRGGAGNIQWTPGLSRVVMFDHQPAWLPDDLVSRLSDRLEGIDGDDFLAIKPGDRVRLTAGPFRDAEALFDRRLNGKQRVAVLLQIMGRQTPVVVSANEIERIA